MIKNGSIFKQNLSEKLMDLGNLMFAGALVNQIIMEGGEKSLFSLVAGIILGLLIYLISYSISYE